MATKVIYFVYRVLGAMLFPAVLFYFLWRVVRNRHYLGTLRQRLGSLPREYQQTAPGSLWFHAVSVGEGIAILPLIHRMRESLPGTSIFVSATTLAGFIVLRDKLGTDVAGVFFAPADYVWAVRRVLRRIRPSVVIIAETEIWPNLFREVRRSGAGLLLINGRISDRAFPRYRMWRWFFRAALSQVDTILAQSETMRERFVAVGAPAERTHVGGNLKYDLRADELPIDPALSQFFRGAKVWIAASTSTDGMVDEEDAVLSTFRELTGWKLLLAPRKPERFSVVQSKLERAKCSFRRRTELRTGETADVLLLDTVGELAGLFTLADAVFMGGTLAACGGHNVLEPAVFGKAITVGPHMENFREIAAEFRQSRAFHEIGSASDLRPYENPEMANRARECAKRNGGATERAARTIQEIRGKSLPSPLRTLSARMLLTPFTALWRAGGARRRASGLRQRKRISAPVISIGNITVGGTGKTPTVLHLAAKLSAMGWRPGVLTRGHGRASPHQLVIVPRGEASTRVNSGDEAQIMIRSGLVSLGVGANRAEAGRKLLEANLADVFLLDDGFQHVALARDFDLVLIDALAPFGGCNLVPLGRLREPLSELRRASAFLITRVDETSPVEAIETELRKHNPSAPVFRSKVVPTEWVELDGSSRYSSDRLPFKHVVAFCGLGNPRSFWKTLKTLDIHPTECLEYGDHHLYTPREVRRFGQLGRALGVQALLTTEKDAANLCELTAEAVRPLRVFSLHIGMEVENEAELLRLIESKIRKT